MQASVGGGKQGMHASGCDSTVKRAPPGMQATMGVGDQARRTDVGLRGLAVPACVRQSAEPHGVWTKNASTGCLRMHEKEARKVGALLLKELHDALRLRDNSFCWGQSACRLLACFVSGRPLMSTAATCGTGT
eukprot:1159306-Pelagomonas_calceolata.AAC.6